MDYKLAGARLVEIKYGLVADLLISNPYTTPYYVSLEFRKGVEPFSEFYSVDSLSPVIHLGDLGKILKHKHQDGKDFYTFTDDSILTVG